MEQAMKYFFIPLALALMIDTAAWWFFSWPKSAHLAFTLAVFYGFRVAIRRGA
jgi:hypothetical protein